MQARSLEHVLLGCKRAGGRAGSLTRSIWDLRVGQAEGFGFTGCAGAATVGREGSPGVNTISSGDMATADLGKKPQQRRRRSRGGQYQRSLYQIAKAINSTRVSGEVPQALLRGAAEAMGAKGSSLLLLNPERDQFLHIAAHGVSETFLRKGPLRVDDMLVKVLTAGAVAVEDAQSDPHVQYPDELKKEKIRSFLSVPLRLWDEVIGMLRVYTTRPRTYPPEAIEFLSAVADLGAVALENAKAYEALQQEVDDTRQELLTWYAERRAAQENPKKPVRFAHPS